MNLARTSPHLSPDDEATSSPNVYDPSRDSPPRFLTWRTSWCSSSPVDKAPSAFRLAPNPDTSFLSVHYDFPGFQDSEPLLCNLRPPAHCVFRFTDSASFVKGLMFASLPFSLRFRLHVPPTFVLEVWRGRHTNTRPVSMAAHPGNRMLLTSQPGTPNAS